MALHRKILTDADLEAFQHGAAYATLEAFLVELVESVKGRALSAVPATPPDTPTGALVGLLRTARTALLARHPRAPADGAARFGSPAFRDWLAELQDALLPAFCAALPAGLDAALLADLAGYLGNVFGSAQRVDYGTGHELHFLAALLHFRALFPDAPAAPLVLHVFWEYLRVMRALQAAYWLEPAGSHGVWGLDDYHFLPFLFGAAQLVGHAHLRPRAIHAPDIVEYVAPEFMYFECVATIVRLKEAISRQHGVVSDASSSSIRWLSPLLDDISAAKSWDKVCTGLLRMWRAEIVGKLPIMQHFLFGRLLSFEPAPNAAQGASLPSATAPTGPAHYRHSLRGDCCGNPLPSIYAALASDRDADEPIHQPGLPFD